MDDDAEAAAAAFDVLSDASRVAILRELADRTRATVERPVEFAELRRAVGFDDAGRFNYHLGKLTPEFVVKRDGGYVPTAVGLKAIGSLEAGTYTEELEPQSAPIDHDCPSCGTVLTADLEDQVVTIACSEDCGTHVQTAVPPAAAADRPVADVVDFVIGDLQRDVEALVDGVCPICSGPVDARGFEAAESGLVTTRVECENCWVDTELPVGVAVLRHPAVVALYHDHGVDLRDRFLTDLSFVGSPEQTTLVSEDPAAADVTAAVGGDEVTLRVDADLSAREV